MAYVQPHAAACRRCAIGGRLTAHGGEGNHSLQTSSIIALHHTLYTAPPYDLTALRKKRQVLEKAASHLGPQRIKWEKRAVGRWSSSREGAGRKWMSLGEGADGR